MKTSEVIEQLIEAGEGEKTLTEIIESVAEYTDLLTQTGTMPVEYAREAAKAHRHLIEAHKALKKAEAIADEVIGK